MSHTEEILKKVEAEKRTINDIAVFRHSDATNAERLCKLYGDKIRFDHTRKRWLVWKGHRWEPDTTESVGQLAVESARSLFREASEIPDSSERMAVAKFAVASEAKKKVDATLSLARQIKPVADEGKLWDTNPMLYCCENGIIDLKTGILRPGKPEDMITMQSGVTYDPNATCPRWCQYLYEVFDGDEVLIRWVKKALGYTLTGHVTEQVVFFGHGGGSNGKSTFFSVIRKLMGDYSMSAPATLFQKNSMNTASNDLASTEVKRFLMCSEVLSSSKLHEQRIKQISGGDAVSARYLYKENFTFEPTAKIWLFLNHLPSVEDDSYAFWRRVRLIPFLHTFKESEQDKNLPEKLNSEISGVLNWMIEGCLLWQQEGLIDQPQAVKVATQNYQAENDQLFEFLNEYVLDLPKDRVGAFDIYNAYRTWAENKGLSRTDLLSNKMFGIRMGDKFKKVRISGKFYYEGLNQLFFGDSSEGQHPKVEPKKPVGDGKPSFSESPREEVLLERVTEKGLLPSPPSPKCKKCGGVISRRVSGALMCNTCNPWIKPVVSEESEESHAIA